MNQTFFPHSSFKLKYSVDRHNLKYKKAEHIMCMLLSTVLASRSKEVYDTISIVDVMKYLGHHSLLPKLLLGRSLGMRLESSFLPPFSNSHSMQVLR